MAPTGTCCFGGGSLALTVELPADVHWLGHSYGVPCNICVSLAQVKAIGWSRNKPASCKQGTCGRRVWSLCDMQLVSCHAAAVAAAAAASWWEGKYDGVGQQPRTVWSCSLQTASQIACLPLHSVGKVTWFSSLADVCSSTCEVISICSRSHPPRSILKPICLCAHTHTYPGQQRVKVQHHVCYSLPGQSQRHHLAQRLRGVVLLAQPHSGMHRPQSSACATTPVITAAITTPSDCVVPFNLGTVSHAPQNDGCFAIVFSSSGRAGVVSAVSVSGVIGIRWRATGYSPRCIAGDEGCAPASGPVAGAHHQRAGGCCLARG